MMALSASLPYNKLLDPFSITAARIEMATFLAFSAIFCFIGGIFTRGKQRLLFLIVFTITIMAHQKISDEPDYVLEGYMKDQRKQETEVTKCRLEAARGNTSSTGVTSNEIEAACRAGLK